MTGAISKRYDSVYAAFSDETKKAATMIDLHDLPVKFYVLLVGRRPVRLVATYSFARGGGEWVDDPIGDNMSWGAR